MQKEASVKSAKKEASVHEVNKEASTQEVHKEASVQGANKEPSTHSVQKEASANESPVKQASVHKEESKKEDEWASQILFKIWSDYIISLLAFNYSICKK